MPRAPSVEPAHRRSVRRLGAALRAVPRQAASAGLNDGHVGAFLTHLAVERLVSAATQRQAASALLFLYEAALRRPIHAPARVLCPKQRRRLPAVLSRAQVRAVLDELSGAPQRGAKLLYGAGPRLLEGLQLPVKDVHFERREITLRRGKGGHGRVTMLPERPRPALQRR